MSAEEFEKKLVDSLEFIILRSHEALSFRKPYSGLFMHKLTIDISFLLSSVLDWEDEKIKEFFKGMNEKMGVDYSRAELKE